MVHVNVNLLTVNQYSTKCNLSSLMQLTLVMPIAPMFSLYEVVPVPVPHSPANTQPIPSIIIPEEQQNKNNR